MTLPPVDIVTFAVGTAAAALVAWLVSGRRRIAMVVSTVSLAGAVAAAVLLQPEGRIPVADRALVWSPFIALWLQAAAASLFALHLVGLAAGERPGSAPTALLALAAVAIGLTLDDPLIALLILTAASLVSVAPAGMAADVRVTIVTAVLALGGAGLTLAVRTPGHALYDRVDVLAFALVVGAVAVAVRTGAIPTALPRRALSTLPSFTAAGAGRAWLPATALLVLLSIASSVAAQPGIVFPVASATIQAAAVSAFAGVGIVAVLARDVRTLVGTTVVANGSLVLFALLPDLLLRSELSPRAATVWLPIFGVTATWAVGWIVALHGTGSELSIDALRGWARRRPILALGLVVGGALSYGLPGSLPWEARAAFLDLAIEPGELRRAAGLLAWLPALGLVRLLLAGLRHGGPFTPATVVAARRHSMARRVGLGRILRGPSVASFLVLVLALAPALLAPGVGDLPAVAGTFQVTPWTTRP